MPRTDKEIAEYVRYYAQQGKRNWAVDMLTKTEGKTTEEILHICRADRSKRAAESRAQNQKPKYSDEFLADIEADRDAGMTYKQIADKYKMPLKTINSIFAIISRNKKKAAAAEQKEPEAYPGQIHDDEPEPVDEKAEPVVESDVKVFMPGEQPQDGVAEMAAKLPFKVEDCTIHIPPKQQLHVPAKNVWFALRDELRDFAVGVFGAGTEIISERVNSSRGHAVIEIETADGDTITLSAVKSMENDYTGGAALL